MNIENGFGFENEFEVSDATRKQIRLKIGMTGPSGSGKTLGALLLAHGLVRDWSKIGFIDSENKSGLYYASRNIVCKGYNGVEKILIGKYKHLPIEAPYDPRKYVAAIHHLIERYGVQAVIIDSASHEWMGDGGCLSLQEKLGGRYTDWAKVTPLHQSFIDTMRDCDAHIIATMRSKQDYQVEQETGKKAKVTKMGTAPVQREGTDYEFGIVFDVDAQHNATASKDRTGLFAGVLPFQITPNVGETLLKWANSGEMSDPIVPPQEPQHHVDQPLPSIYEAQDGQKKVLAQLLKPYGVADPNTMREISSKVIGVAMEDLPAVIEKWMSPPPPPPPPVQAVVQKGGISESPKQPPPPLPPPPPPPVSKTGDLGQTEPIITGTVETDRFVKKVLSPRLITSFRTAILVAEQKGVLKIKGVGNKILDLIISEGWMEEQQAMEILADLKAGNGDFFNNSYAAVADKISQPANNEPEDLPF